ncbi:hypothetical protein CEP54_001428 [Fusarium duplospermum]|uniref:Uncharacterized protein n=1 Tax=Fusarium duplospermum TaxID=1325734 RepID=A0A428R0L5_9HYPO|nr:hypothetical protein CEP54_001428 [Fusarium duplospermum]
MVLSTSNDEGEHLGMIAGRIAVSELNEQEITAIDDQMVREIFRLAGRNPMDHANCFQACVQTVRDTDVIHATDFKDWEKHPRVKNTLDNLESANRRDGPATIWMINAPVAVAAAAAVNLLRIHIQEDSRLIRAFNKNNLWGWIGSAIDFWSTLPHSLHSLPRESIVNVIHLENPTGGSSSLQPTTPPLQSFTLPLLVHLRISRMANVVGDRLWLQKRSIPKLLITRREEAMEKGKSVLCRLGIEKYNQAGLRTLIHKWLSEGIIRVLPKHVKDKLWVWCLGHHSYWQSFIAQASEDLTEYHEIVDSEEIIAPLASHEFESRLNHGRCLVFVLKHGVLRDNLEKIIHQMRQANRDEFSAFSNVTRLQRLMIQRLEEALSPGRHCPSFVGFDERDTRRSFIRIIQRVLDASITLTPKCPALVKVWLVLLPKMDDELLSCICFDMEKAKERQSLTREREFNTKEFCKMATVVKSIDPESCLIAYTIFFVHMRHILDWQDSALLERCLAQPPIPRSDLRELADSKS